MKMGAKRDGTLVAATASFLVSPEAGFVSGQVLYVAGGPLSSSAWTAAFSVLAAGILLGPVALYWSRIKHVVLRVD